MKRDEFGLPDELDQVINTAIERGKKTVIRVKRRNGFFKGAALLVVALGAALVVGVNALPSFAESLSDVGAAGLVKVLTFERWRAEGGEATDGQQISRVELGGQGGGERITINLQGEAGLPPGAFEVAYLEYPYRLVVTLNGVRSFPGAEGLAGIKGELVKSVYRMPTLDDSAERLVITLSGPVELSVQEQNDPPGILIDLRTAAAPAGLKPLYFLNSASYPFGEEVGVIEGMLKWEMELEAWIIPDRTGNLVVSTGGFESEAEALIVKGQIFEALGIDMVVEFRGPGDLPQPAVGGCC